MKTAYDTTIGKSVRAAVLTYNGEFAGRILAVWGAGGQCRTTVSVWAGPLKDLHDGSATQTAGGGGYDKFGSCLAGIFESYKVELTDPYNGGNNKTTLSRILDGGSYDRAFKAAGYEYYQVA
jgi:hypothetical protein